MVGPRRRARRRPAPGPPAAPRTAATGPRTASPRRRRTDRREMRRAVRPRRPAASAARAASCAPPMPTPNWLPGAAPNSCCSESKAQPLAPMAKPRSATPPGRSPLRATSTRPCARPGLMRSDGCSPTTPRAPPTTTACRDRSACIRPCGGLGAAEHPGQRPPQRQVLRQVPGQQHEGQHSAQPATRPAARAARRAAPFSAAAS